MIKSLWRIRFTVIQSGHARNGEVVTLLDFGDRCDDDPAIEPTQGNAASAAIFQGNTSNFPLGAVTLNLSWTRYREAATNAAARNTALAEISGFPWGLQGKITIAIEGGSTIDYARSAVLTMSPTYPKKSDVGAIHFTYTAALGKPTTL